MEAVPIVGMALLIAAVGEGSLIHQAPASSLPVLLFPAGRPPLHDLGIV
jgi:hypothetical protein